MRAWAALDCLGGGTLSYDRLMREKLTERDREIFERKEAQREQDRQRVAAGETTFETVNRSNAIASSVIHLYRPGSKPGLPR